MKLKVKIRREDRQSLLPSLIATVIFGSIGIACLVGIVHFVLNFNLEYFIEVFSAEGMAMTIVFALGMVGLYLVYLLLKFPGRYVGVLKKKENISYKDNTIWQMEFIVKGEEGKSVTLFCYTDKENELEVGKEYVVLLKEYSWRIKSIGDKVEGREYKLVKEPSLKIVFYLFFFIFGSGVVFLLFKILYDIEKGNDYLINIFPIVICGAILFYIYMVYRSCYYDESSKDEQNDEGKKENNIYIDGVRCKRILQNSKTLKSKGKAPNLFMRMFPVVLYKYVISFFIGLFFFNIVSVSLGAYGFFELLWINRNFYFCWFIMVFVCGIINLLFVMAPYIKNDKKLINKFNLFVDDNKFEIKDLHGFRIFSPDRNMDMEKYYIVDNKKIIYKIDVGGIFKNKYIMSDNLSNKIGEIKRKSFRTGDLYLVRLINREVFGFRKKITSDNNYIYEVLGRDYEVIYDGNVATNLIIDIKDNKKIATIKAKEDKNNTYVIGDSEVILGDDVINDEEIMALSLCITIEKNRFNI